MQKTAAADLVRSKVNLFIYSVWLRIMWDSFQTHCLYTASRFQLSRFPLPVYFSLFYSLCCGREFVACICLCCFMLLSCLLLVLCFWFCSPFLVCRSTVHVFALFPPLWFSVPTLIRLTCVWFKSMCPHLTFPVCFVSHVAPSLRFPCGLSSVLDFCLTLIFLGCLPDFDLCLPSHPGSLCAGCQSIYLNWTRSACNVCVLAQTIVLLLYQYCAKDNVCPYRWI